MPIFAGLAGATLATGILGDVTSAAGTAMTNDTNAQINQQNLQGAWDRQQNSQAFNAVQASIGRDFSAQQVQQQEAFQDKELGKVEAYDTNMSNTAMQRRAQDLRNAGINPLLAVAQGGASAPMVSAPSGSAASASTASGGPAGAPGPIPMQNPTSAFGNLGGIMSSAIEASKAGASIDLLKAQTAKTQAEAGIEIPAQVEQMSAMTGLATAQARQVVANIQLIHNQAYEAETAGARNDSQAALNSVMTSLQGQNLEVLKATRDALISAANSDALAKTYKLPELRNMSDINKTTLGFIIDSLNKMLEPVGTALGAAKGLIHVN